MTRPEGEAQPIVADRRRKMDDILAVWSETGRIRHTERLRLAERWGTSPRHVENFLGRNLTEIYSLVEMRRQNNQEGVWIADPEWRFRSRQDDVEIITRLIIESWHSGAKLPSRLMEIKERVFENIARELGQVIPPPMPEKPTPEPMQIEIVGVDPAAIFPAAPVQAQGWEDAEPADLPAPKPTPTEAAPPPSVGVAPPDLFDLLEDE